jgi:biopolymer transport protein ExbD
MRFSTRQRGVLELDMTPMIDVTFLLLIFFLVSAQMAARSRGDVRLPVQAGEAQTHTGVAGLVVLVRADGSMLVGEAPVDAARLTELARALPQGAGAAAPVIRADRDAPASALNAAARALQRGGVPTFRLATELGAAR